MAEPGKLSTTSNVSKIQNADAQTVTWDLTSLNLSPGRYQVLIDGTFVNSHEAEILIAYRGDVDLDGDVGFDDFLAVAASFGQPDSSWIAGDFDGDGIFNFADFLDLATNFGKSVDAITN